MGYENIQQLLVFEETNVKIYRCEKVVVGWCKKRTTSPITHQCILIGLRTLVKSVYQKKNFSFFSTKAYVVGTQKKRLNETVLLSTQNICLN